MRSDFILELFVVTKSHRLVRKKNLWTVYFLFIPADVNSEPCQTSEIVLFAEIVNNWEPLTIFAKRSILTHFSPVSHLYTPRKRQKTKGFLTFSGGIEIWYWTKMGLRYTIAVLNISLHIQIHIKIIPLKFRILNRKNSRVIHP